MYFPFLISFVLRLKQSHLECSTVAIQGEFRLGSPKNLSLAKDLSALRSNLERHPSSRGDNNHPATLSKRSSQKAHLGHFIYGTKCLAHGQIAYNRKGVHKTPCIHKFLCFFMKEYWKNCPLTV